MSYLLIGGVALLISGVSFLSGFGLGTVLMPAFALFVPVETAIAATALVHLAVSVFQGALIAKHANYRMVIKFAVPAALFAVVGALLLGYLASIPPVFVYRLGNAPHQITAIKLVVATLIGVFSIAELFSRFHEWKVSEKYIPLGGALSGFFGGLSGHQGAFRSAFLIQAGLEKEEFVGTARISSIVIDLARLIVYGVTLFRHQLGVLRQEGIWSLVLVGSLAGFLGSFLGSRFLKKVTLKNIRLLVGAMLLVFAVAMGAGLI